MMMNQALLAAAAAKAAVAATSPGGCFDCSETSGGGGGGGNTPNGNTGGNTNGNDNRDGDPGGGTGGAGGRNQQRSPTVRATFSPPSPYAAYQHQMRQQLNSSRQQQQQCNNNNNSNTNTNNNSSSMTNNQNGNGNESSPGSSSHQPQHHSHHPSHVTQNTANIFTAAGLDVSVAELHDLTSRTNQGGNLKATDTMSSAMYHHHMMQSRQHPAHGHHPHHHHHPSADAMHDFLSGADPMATSLPAALGLAASTSTDPSGNHHTGASVGNQLHHPSSAPLYSSHHHGPMNMNGMITSLHHHHTSGGQLGGHQIQSPFHPHHPSSFVSAAAAASAASSPHHQLSAAAAAAAAAAVGDPSLLEADPRELEVFAERFKQRRIKLGVTQADVGKALANLKLPGVGSLSQSTICRFESLTLSHNNMVALKPILQAWLEAAEAQARKNRITRETTLDICVLPSLDKKRKRTSIAAPEKRSLEAYFSVQPRPSGEKIAAIAEKLDLKKNVVRVWFCNQRQKQKRMKYSAVNGPGGNGQGQ